MRLRVVDRGVWVERNWDESGWEEVRVECRVSKEADWRNLRGVSILADKILENLISKLLPESSDSEEADRENI